MLKVHDPAFRIVKDIDLADTNKLLERARHLAPILRAAVNRQVGGGTITAEQVNNSGEIDVVVLPADYSNPLMLAHISRCIIPHAAELLEHAERHKVESLVTAAFGRAVCQYIEKQGYSVFPQVETKPKAAGGAQIISLASYR